jgi:uncharacterized protein
MVFSIYNYIFRSAKFGCLLYNAETNAFAELDDIVYAQLLKAKETNDLSELDSELIGDLAMAKILVQDNNKDFFYRKRLKYYFRNFEANDLGFALAPTTFCNFSCSYCYEKNRKPIFMTEETENQFISFIKKHESVKNVDITWYGGEPLANFKSIKRILGKLEKDRTINLRDHSIVTNGYLLDENKSKFFSEHHINHVQITIDGSKGHHDKRRTLVGGGPTYDTIIRNIDTFFKHNGNTPVSVRVNMDSSNKDTFYDLFTELTTRWEGKPFGIYPAFVQDYEDGNEVCSMGCELLNQEDCVKFYFDLHNNYGADVKFYPKLKVGGCGATNINYYIVGPSGELYKCWNDIGIEERVIGDLNNNSIPNYDVLCQYLVGPSMFDDEKCKMCNVFPICDGGCHRLRLKNVNEGKNFNLCTNKKTYLEPFLEAHYEALNSRNRSNSPLKIDAD